jgi:riboflavin synthase
MMFSGIIEEIGTVNALNINKNMITWDGKEVQGVELKINCNQILEDAYIGCSIAVNGVCLTVTEFDKNVNYFVVGLAPETLRRSNLGIRYSY